MEQMALAHGPEGQLWGKSVGVEFQNYALSMETLEMIQSVDLNSINVETTGPSKLQAP